MLTSSLTILLSLARSSLVVDRRRPTHDLVGLGYRYLLEQLYQVQLVLPPASRLLLVHLHEPVLHVLYRPQYVSVRVLAVLSLVDQHLPNADQVAAKLADEVLEDRLALASLPLQVVFQAFVFVHDRLPQIVEFLALARLLVVNVELQYLELASSLRVELIRLLDVAFELQLYFPSEVMSDVT